MLSPGAGTKIYLALEPVDMRRGFDGLAGQVAGGSPLDPSRARCSVPGKGGGLDEGHPMGGQGLCLFAKRLGKGRFVWPTAREGIGAFVAGAAIDADRWMDWRRAVLEPEPVHRVWC